MKRPVAVILSVIMFFSIAFFVYFAIEFDVFMKKEKITCLKNYTAISEDALFYQLGVLDNELLVAEAVKHHSIYEDVPTVSEYTVEGKTVLWFDQKDGKAYVDSRYFGDLTITDATQPGFPMVGTVQDELREMWGEQKIVEFLLDAHIITTYWHLGSSFCLTREFNGAEWYEATFVGSHEYMTNTSNSGPLNFTVKIHKETGDILVTRPE